MRLGHGCDPEMPENAAGRLARPASERTVLQFGHRHRKVRLSVRKLKVNQAENVHSEAWGIGGTTPSLCVWDPSCCIGGVLATPPHRRKAGQACPLPVISVCLTFLPRPWDGATSLRLGHVTDTRDRCLPSLSVGALVPRAPGPSLRSPVLLSLAGLGSPSLRPHPPWAARGAGWGGVLCVANAPPAAPAFSRGPGPEFSPAEAAVGKCRTLRGAPRPNQVRILPRAAWAPVGAPLTSSLSQSCVGACGSSTYRLP